MNAHAHDSPASVLTLDALAVGYDRRAILPALSLEVRSGELWALVGPNGCGKSTLLRTLLGLQPAITGRMAWGPKARIGYVPQRTRLDPSMPARVVDVVRSGLDRAWSFLNPLHARRHADAIARAMRDTHTAELAAQPFGQLSEGQKQRVLMARALVGDPAVLVLDEPTSAMDMRAEHDTFALIECLRHDRELAVLLVSHHLPVVAEFATHVMLLDRDADALLAGPIAELADHPGCRARYGSILQEGIARRARHLCALSEDELDHVHDHNHHPHAHHHDHHHDAHDHDHHDHHHDHHHHHHHHH